MPSKDPNANTSRGSNRGRSESLSDEKQIANMKSFLTGLSYVIPAGLGLNALRIAYKAAKAGKAATGLAKKADAVAKASITPGASKVKTVGERIAENRLAADKATLAKIRTNKLKAKAVGNAKVAGVAGATALAANTSAGSRTKTETKKPTSTKTITTGSGAATVQPKKEATPKTSSQGNIGRTTTKYDTPKGKARVEKLPTDAKEKKVSGPGTYQGGKSYMNSNYSNYMNNSFNRRK